MGASKVSTSEVVEKFKKLTSIRTSGILLAIIRPQFVALGLRTRIARNSNSLVNTVIAFINILALT